MKEERIERNKDRLKRRTCKTCKNTQGRSQTNCQKVKPKAKHAFCAPTPTFQILAGVLGNKEINSNYYVVNVPALAGAMCNYSTHIHGAGS
jgi:hypothetical protein